MHISHKFIATWQTDKLVNLYFFIIVELIFQKSTTPPLCLTFWILSKIIRALAIMLTPSLTMSFGDVTASNSAPVILFCLRFCLNGVAPVPMLSRNKPTYGKDLEFKCSILVYYLVSSICVIADKKKRKYTELRENAK